LKGWWRLRRAGGRSSMGRKSRWSTWWWLCM